MKLIAIAVLMVATICSSQTAKVIQLDPADAAEAARLDAQMKALVAKQDAFRKAVFEKYLVTKDEKQGGNEYYSAGSSLTSGYITSICVFNSTVECPAPTPKEKSAAEKARKEAEARRRWVRRGWGGGDFEYSEDFKFIVPKQTIYSISAPIGNCFSVSPAVWSSPCCATYTTSPNIYTPGLIGDAPNTIFSGGPNDGSAPHFTSLSDGVLPPSISNAYRAK